MDYLTTLENVWQNTSGIWKPPENITGSEWADKYYYLSEESSAQPGKWKTIPYQKGILDAITDPDVERISIRKSSRVGYTKMLNICIGLHIHIDPCSLMMVQPTIEDGQGYSKDELATMIRDTPVLSEIIGDTKGRDSNNTILKKHYPGGSIVIVGANSPRGFRRISVRKVLNDEIDAYPLSAGIEGDQIELGERRTEYFWNRQIINGSTPVVKDLSKIDKLFHEGDQRYYHVPCPFCGFEQPLVWDNIDYSDNGTVDNPVYICASCAKPIPYKKQRWMIENGRWVAKKEFNGHASFHIWSAYSYSPNATWSHIVKKFIASKGDREKLQVWVNTWKGEPFDEPGDKLDVNELYARREPLGLKVPYDAGVLTCSIDCQGDRVEAMVVAWGENERAWILDWQVFYGDLATTELWNTLDLYLLQEWEHETGLMMKLDVVFIDSGGHFTDQVYTFCKPRNKRKVFAIKGASKAGVPIVGKATNLSYSKNKKKGAIGGKLFNIGVFSTKEILAARLKKKVYGSEGYIHLPDRFPEEFFYQLASERKLPRYKKGSTFYEWVKVYERNEIWDLLNYAFAGLRFVCPAIGVLNARVKQIEGIAYNKEHNIPNKPTKPGRRVISKGLE